MAASHSLASRRDARRPAVTDPIAAWHTEHAYFAQLLRLLRKEIDVFHAGGEPNYELMVDVLRYLREYSDRVHHPREDIAFARLARHCPDLRLVLSRLQQEHRVIAAAGVELLAKIEAVVGGEVVPREHVEAAAATYLVYYESHLAKEEAEVLDRARAHLTPTDWDAVRSGITALPDPLFGRDPQERFRGLRRQIARES
jgi:hemerythrin-like domain-containing protein